MSIQIISYFLSTVSNFLALSGTEEEGMVSILMRGVYNFYFLDEWNSHVASGF